MRRSLAAQIAFAATALAGSASAQAILGAGRESIALRWEAASGPVAHYEVTCTVRGQPDVLVGTTTGTQIEIVRDPAGGDSTFGSCAVQAFDAQGNPGPPSEPSAESFEFLPDVDLDGDGSVGRTDLLWLLKRFRGGFADVRAVVAINRTLGCRVDRATRTYVDCGATQPAP